MRLDDTKGTAFFVASKYKSSTFCVTSALCANRNIILDSQNLEGLRLKGRGDYVASRTCR